MSKMFSNIGSQMSQVTGFFGAKKGDEDPSKNEEKVPTPTAEPDGAPAADMGDAAKSGSKLEMLSNVKGHMTSWMGSVQVPSVPSFFTKGGETGPTDSGDAKVDSPTSGESVKGSPELKDEDDNSRLLKKTNEVLKKVAAPVTDYVTAQWASLRATGGADSDAVPEEEETNEEGKEAGIGGVSTKAVAGAKTIGNFLFSAVNKAGETVSKAGAKIKKTVEENALLADFNKEQDAFISEKDGKDPDAAVPPWVGVPNEESLKDECLLLSTDRRNFVRAPPPGVDFPFDYETSYKVAIATLAEDPNLEKMRFELVPKVVNEENFWRNYFYRVSLLRQQAELSAMEPGGQPSRTSSVDAEPLDRSPFCLIEEEEWERELATELEEYNTMVERIQEPITDDDLEDLK